MALPEIFANLPTLAANGPGAAVDVSQMAGSKTITNTGNGYLFEPIVTIEIANDAAGVNFVPVYTFQAGAGEVTLPLACKWMRTVTSNYRGGGAAVVDAGAETDPGTFAQLVAPPTNGSGAPVVTSTLLEYKTIVVAGTFRGTVNIEISEDGGTTWTGALSFSAPGTQSGFFSAQQMRITRVGVPDVNPGLPLVDVGSDTFGAGGGVGGAGVALSAGTQLATSGTAVFSNSNGLSFGMSNSSVVTASMDAIRAISGGTTNATGSGVSFANSNGVSFGFSGQTLTVTVTPGAAAGIAALQAGTQTATSGTVSFANSNGMSYGLSGSTRITGQFDGIRSVIAGSQTAAGTAAATVSFANSNGVSFGMSGSNTITASFTPETPFGVSAGSQSASTGTVAFVNSNGVTFGMSNSNQVTASVAAETPFGISAGTQSVSTGTVSFANSNNVTFGMSGSNTITASVPNAIQEIAVGGIATGPIVAFADGNGISFGTLGGVNTIGVVYDGIRSVIAGSQTAAGTANATVSFANSNGVTFGMSGTKTITASVLPETPFAVSAGSQSVSTGTVSFANSNGITFGMSGSNTITASVEAPISISQWSPWNGFSASSASLIQNNLFFQPIAAFDHVVFSQFQMRVFITGSTNSTATGQLSIHFGVYTRNGSSLSLLHNTTFNSSIDQSGTVNASLYHGIKVITAPWTSTITRGDYWVGILMGSATTSQDFSISNMVGQAQAVAFSGPFGAASSASNQIALGIGAFSNVTAALPVSVAFTDIRGTGAVLNRCLNLWTLGPASV